MNLPIRVRASRKKANSSSFHIFLHRLARKDVARSKMGLPISNEPIKKSSSQVCPAARGLVCPPPTHFYHSFYGLCAHGRWTWKNPSLIHCTLSAFLVQVFYSQMSLYFYKLEPSVYGSFPLEYISNCSVALSFSLFFCLSIWLQTVSSNHTMTWRVYCFELSSAKQISSLLWNSATHLRFQGSNRMQWDCLPGCSIGALSFRSQLSPWSSLEFPEYFFAVLRSSVLSPITSH